MSFSMIENADLRTDRYTILEYQFVNRRLFVSY